MKRKPEPGPRVRLFIGERVFLVQPIEPLPEMPARMGWLAVELGGRTFAGRLDEVDTTISPQHVAMAALSGLALDD